MKLDLSTHKSAIGILLFVLVSTHVAMAFSSHLSVDVAKMFTEEASATFACLMLILKTGTTEPAAPIVIKAEDLKPLVPTSVEDK